MESFWDAVKQALTLRPEFVISMVCVVYLVRYMVSAINTLIDNFSDAVKELSDDAQKRADSCHRAQYMALERHIQATTESNEIRDAAIGRCAEAVSHGRDMLAQTQEFMRKYIEGK